MKIFFIGYMGSGKSFFSKKLSDLINVKYVDLDVLIENDESMKIEDIFSKKGEVYFRKQERKMLKKIIKENTDCIISSGGGTPCFFNNFELMNGSGLTIYLKSDIEKLYSVLINSNQTRPLFKKLETKEHFINHLKEREKFYLKSKIIVDCNQLLDSEILQKIKNKLYEYRFKK